MKISTPQNLEPKKDGFRVRAGDLGSTILELTLGMHIEEPHHQKIPLAVRKSEEAKYRPPLETKYDENSGLYGWARTHQEED